MAKSSGRKIQSVDRAIRLLKLVQSNKDGIRLTDLASKTKLNISTCHHLLATLIEHDLVAQDDSRLYRAA